ncbi:MAG TPA: hypothetical protein DCG57_03515 [Candidatus Riflebacteria bacterium]|jgi:hypothetical protein|nr:hypothetical protein [Candidatus Riflebacteria bacterium]
MNSTSTVERIANLQSMTAEIRSRMVGDLFQFHDAKDGTSADLSLEIVAGYLQQASEDACAMADAMCSRFARVEELGRLTELSERSFNQFLRALQAWKEQCLH